VIAPVVLALAKVQRIAAQAVDDAESGDAGAGEAMYKWMIRHVDALAECLAVDPLVVRDIYLCYSRDGLPRAFLDLVTSKATRERVRDARRAAESSEADDAAAWLASGAVRLDAHTWSVDPAALVELARALPRTATIAVTFADRDVFVSVATVRDAAKVTPEDGWTCDVRIAGAHAALEIRCGGARGYRLNASRLASTKHAEIVRAGGRVVSLPAAMPRESGPMLPPDEEHTRIYVRSEAA